MPAEFGLERVRDTPISETSIVGAGIGAALAGMLPIVDMHFADFLGVAMDEVLNQMAKIRYMFGGQASLPLVLRAPDGVTRSGAAQHSQSLEAIFMHIPGIKVVVPSNPEDAKGLLKSAIRDPNPVIYFEHKDLFRRKGPVPEEEYITPIGKAKVTQQGDSLTIVSYSRMFTEVEAACKRLGDEVRNKVELIDLRSIVPMDTETILESVRKTHRLLVVHEAVKRGGVGAEISAVVAEHAVEYLDAPTVRIGAKPFPVPFSPTLEPQITPQVDEIVAAVRGLLNARI
ncbi:alpha-ketoacid dehydrogenase subunit beta [Alicyclobacillus fastidiosus]|uniref:alpha-ketoacid dehydrogenase subunit beta n=1 Tax=Alicyclobacillus fastidiosus TaxID=392011 RepID=UPI0023E97EE5|nr:TPP-dependent acetoin dehydrogenase complex, E1 protein subunit beta [Alicyclobacillus fastidiosus]